MKNSLIVPQIPENATMEEMISAVWRLPRDIISDGFDAAIYALSRSIPMTLHEYATGTECFTWIIPEKWVCYEAYLETLAGRRIFSYHDNPLHVVSYSLPFEGIVTREKLFEHLHVHPKLHDAIPFVFKYYERDWGLCCSNNLKDTLTEEKYRVLIKTEFISGTLKVGEVIAPGRSEESIVLCAHLCHPCMVNDDLTGVVVGIEVMRELKKRKDLRYTYRFLIVPETIGSAAYLSHNEHLIPRMKGGLFLEMLGTDFPHAIQRSYNGSTEIDQCAEMIVKENNDQSWADDFLTIIYNDERMFNAPGIRVPMISLSRVLPRNHKDRPYREYHSSLDTPDSINFSNLEKSRDVVLKIIDALEGNCIPVPKFKGELFCSKYKGIEYGRMFDIIIKVVFRLDGKRTIADIAQDSNISFNDVKSFLKILEAEDL